MLAARNRHFAALSGAAPSEDRAAAIVAELSDLGDAQFLVELTVAMVVCPALAEPNLSGVCGELPVDTAPRRNLRLLAMLLHRVFTGGQVLHACLAGWLHGLSKLCHRVNNELVIDSQTSVQPESLPPSSTAVH